jgi:enoyl-CoA hydratase
MNELVRYEVEELGNIKLATITMDDGKANGLSPTMIKAINEAFDKADADEAMVILSGREGKFSAGFDLGVFQQGAEALTEMLKGGAELAERLMLFPRPVIAACNGHGLAMGALLLLASDYRIGAIGNFKLGLNEVAIGLTMPAFGCEIARFTLTPQFFKRCLVNAEIFSPEAALQPGFLDEVVEVENLSARAKEKATEMAALNMGAFQGTKLGARKDALDALRGAIEKDFGA